MTKNEDYKKEGNPEIYKAYLGGHQINEAIKIDHF